MSDELKSAWELALERLEAAGDSGIRKLTDGQKERIAEVRAIFRARVAEAELGARERVSRAIGAGDFERAEKIRDELASEKKRLDAEVEARVEAIRQESD